MRLNDEYTRCQTPPSGADAKTRNENYGSLKHYTDNAHLYDYVSAIFKHDVLRCQHYGKAGALIFQPRDMFEYKQACYICFTV